MNSRYWEKTLIKLLKLTNSVYNFNNNGSETEKIGIKTSMLAGDHVVTQAVQDTLTREYISTQGMLTREARKHSRHVCTWTQEHTKHVGTWARKHARHVAMWARKHARHAVT